MPNPVLRGRFGLAVATGALALLVFALFWGFRNTDQLFHRSQVSPRSGDGPADKTPKLPTRPPPGRPQTTVNDKPQSNPAGQPEEPPLENPPRQAKDGPGQASRSEEHPDLLPSVMGGGTSEGHPPPIPWKGPKDEFDFQLKLTPNGRAAGRAALPPEAARALRSLLGEGVEDSFIQIMGERASVNYREAGHYQSLSKPKPGGAAPQVVDNGSYMILGNSDHDSYVLLMPQGKTRLRVLKYGAEGEYKLVEPAK